MRYIVIIYYVLIEEEQIFETLNVNKNIEASSPEEAIASRAAARFPGCRGHDP